MEKAGLLHRRLSKKELSFVLISYFQNEKGNQKGEISVFFNRHKQWQNLKQNKLKKALRIL
jgi:hypothetical protein